MLTWARPIITSAMGGMFGVALAALPLAPSATARALLSSAVLLALAGALLGVGFGLAHALLMRLPDRGRCALWLALGLAAGASVAWKLGAFHKLHGPHGRLALIVISGGACGGLGLGALAFAIQPDSHDLSPLLRARRTLRWEVIALLLLVAIGVEIAEANASVLNAYPAARRALAGFAWTCSLSAATLALRCASWTPRTLAAAGGLSSALLVFGGATLATATEAQLGLLAGANQTGHAVGLLRSISDWDRDGSSSLLGGGDCAPFDGAVHPLARELPGNGVDDNCNFGDGKAAPKFEATALVAAKEPPPVDILLITIDSLRADRTTPYGYARETTPNLARFASTALRFDNAYTSGAWTCLAIPSMLSGVYPRQLNWTSVGMNTDGEMFQALPNGALPAGHRAVVSMTFPADPERWTVQSALSARGIRTVGVLNRWAAFVVKIIGEGFDVADLSDSLDDATVTALAKDYLFALADEPFFLWVHYYNPHWPMEVHANVPRFGDGLGDRYDHEVAATDRELGELLDAAEAASGRPLAVIIAADHGELLSGQEQSHGIDLNQESIRIPLLLRAPGVTPGVVDTPVSLVDVAPTVLALAGLAGPANLSGTDLRKVPGNRAVISDLWRVELDGSISFDGIAVIDAGHQLTYDRLLNRKTLSSVRDRGSPPLALDRSLTPPLLEHTLGSYVDSQVGGPAHRR
jgi:hypothetical protein